MRNFFLKNSLTVLFTVVMSLSVFGVENGTQKVNTATSEITWRGDKLTGHHEGTIALKEGALIFANDELVGGSFVIDMTTIVVTDLAGGSKKSLEKHLKSDDFFGVDIHKKSSFEIKTVKKKGNGVYTVSGDIIIKNKSFPNSFDMKIDGNKVTADIEIDRSKYDIRYKSSSFFDNLGDKVIYDIFKIRAELKF